jgi:predicted acylesterase/phospholipase RssA
MAIPIVPEFNKTDKNSTVITNFMLQQENWENLRKFLEALIANLGDVITTDLLDSIIDTIFSNLNQYKKNIVVEPYNMTDGQQLSFTIGSEVYYILKMSSQSFRITKDSPEVWNTHNLIIQVSLIDDLLVQNTAITPLIKKFENYFEIHFDSSVNDVKLSLLFI